MNQTKTSKLKLLSALLALPVATFAQDTELVTSSYFSNALFDTLIVAILLLLILIVAMSSVLKNLTQSEYFLNKYKTKNTDSTSGSKVVALLALFSLLGGQLLAQAAEPVKAVSVDDWRIGGLDGFTFYFLLAIIIIEGIAIYILFNLIKSFIKTDKVVKAPKALYF